MDIMTATEGSDRPVTQQPEILDFHKQQESASDTTARICQCYNRGNLSLSGKSEIFRAKEPPKEVTPAFGPDFARERGEATRTQQKVVVRVRKA